MNKPSSALPDYQQEFSPRSIKNYLAGVLANIGTGGFSAMLFSSWLTFVYSEYLGVDAALIGSVVAIGIIVDGISDFVMGFVMDRAISRWGKAKHWLLISALPVAITIWLMWMIPESVPEAGKVIWAFVMYNLFCTFLTIARMPTQALPALVSDSNKVRSNMAYVMNIVASFSSAALGWVITPVTNQFGQTLLAYRIIALICGIITMVCLFGAGFLLTEQRSGAEWKTIQEKYKKHNHEKKESVLDQLKNLLKNKFWILYVVINIMTGCSVFFGMGVMAHWINYVLGDPSKTGIIMTVMNVPTLFGTLLFLPISRKLGIKTIAILTAFLGGAFSLVMWIAGPAHFEVLIGAMGIKTFIGGISAPLAMVVIPRIIDYGEWKTGSRQEGLCNSCVGVMSKIVASAATALVGFILTASGWVAGGVVPESAVEAINFLFLGVPTIAMILSGICWMFFTLDDKKAEQYRQEVEARKEKDLC